MAHKSQLDFVRLLSDSFPGQFCNRRVLEIGSLDINGSIRGLFHDCEYVGLDVADGKGVDVVCEGQKYIAPDNSHDVLISCEAMEHNPFWLETFQNMIRICRPGGLVIMTCATTGRPEHGTKRSEPESSPLTVGLGWNYYRNLTQKDFCRAVDIANSFAAHRFWTRWNHYDLLFVGIKRGQLLSNEEAKSWGNATRAIDDWIDVDKGIRVLRYRAALASALGDWWFVAMHRLLAVMNRLTNTMGRLHRPY